MVSYVEFYRPKYFLLENVVGMLSHKLGQKRDGVDETGMTVVKFLFRAMVALGYVNLTLPFVYWDIQVSIDDTTSQVPGPLQSATGCSVRCPSGPRTGDILGRPSRRSLARLPVPDTQLQTQVEEL